MAERWEKIFQIDVLFSETNKTYAARIRDKGLTAYGSSSAEAVGKVQRMLSISEKVKGENNAV